jgi:predicted DNA-binding transcriptional regulator YafY
MDRIAALEPREQHFERPTDFDALSHVLNSLGSIPGPYEVEILMQTTLHEAQQAVGPMFATLEETPDGILLRRAVRQLEWMAYFLLGLAFPVVIRQPDELRVVIRDIGKRFLTMAGEMR